MLKKKWYELPLTVESQWHPTKNHCASPCAQDKLKDKVWWLCSQGHEFVSLANNVIYKKSGCGVCAGKQINVGINDLASLRPDVTAWWDYTQNITNPESYSVSSNKYAYWICEKNHSFRDSINHLTSGRGCPYCSGRRLLEGFNDLKTKYKYEASEWDFNKNKIGPDQVFPGTTKEYFWLCFLNHSYKMSPNKRTSSKQGCPYCSGQKILVGFNDLKTTNPKVASLWHPFLNKETTTQMVTRGTNKLVWWKCSQGHEWKKTVKNQSRIENICLECINPHTSAIENKLFLAMGRYLSNIQSNFKLDAPFLRAKKVGVDILGYYGKHLVAIEYDGSFWHNHSDREKIDIDKTRGLIAQNIFVIRVRENSLKFLNYSDSYFVQINYKYGTDVNILATQIEKILQDKFFI